MEMISPTGGNLAAQLLASPVRAPRLIPMATVSLIGSTRTLTLMACLIEDLIFTCLSSLREVRDLGGML
jgi:hypothetical protein